VKFKRTPMRLLIGLLLQNPALAQLDYDLSSLRGLNEPGFDLFNELTVLCRDHIGITMGQILEYWRDTKNSKPLEILALWDHLIEEDKIEDTFRDTLAYLYIQFMDQHIEELIAKDRTTGLEIAEKQELAQLLSERQQNNNS
ncbi:MAG TPA: DNA primase, partial [Pasteurellaceae bacterium]|nr:DNA primase [Pasteurellaceae bacterium]